MAHTVKELARISGVSVRTLHFYDELGLLKPAFHGVNGYRYYESEQLLLLQQILFYRELGFELKRIKEIILKNDFDKIEALTNHRKMLRKDSRKIQGLLETIDKTIKHLKGKRVMKDKEMFHGFNKAEQAKHEKYLIDRYGEKMKTNIEESRQKVKNWTKQDWVESGLEFESICAELTTQLRKNLSWESAEVQGSVRRHFRWLSRFWTPNRASYTGHSCLIVDSELRKAYEKHDPQLPEFLALAMVHFAERQLA